MMSYFNICCIGLVIFALSDEMKTKKSESAFDTFHRNNGLALPVKSNAIILKRRLGTLIARRKLHRNRLKSTRNKMAARWLRTRMKTLRRSIEKLRRKLARKQQISKSKQLRFSVGSLRELRELHANCRKQGCAQLCTPEGCSCYRGFHLDANDNKTCVDVNECQLMIARCEHKCVNTFGSHYCTCPHGKRPSYNRSACADINECFLNNNHGPCQDGCVNVEGSYSCTCTRLAGTRLAQNDHTCQDVDECLEYTSGCTHYCHNVYNSFVCSCPDGMLLQDDDRTCIDVDECRTINDGNGGACNGKCFNTIGSYFCLDSNKTNVGYSTCAQLQPTEDGYYLCNRDDRVKVIQKGITDREHFLNTPGTICTYHTRSHVATVSHVCTNHAKWTAYPLTIINN